jgi:hypothetical protein
MPRHESPREITLTPKWTPADRAAFEEELARGGGDDAVAGRCEARLGKPKKLILARIQKSRHVPLTRSEESERIWCVYQGWPPGSCLLDVAVLAHLERQDWSFPLHGFCAAERDRIMLVMALAGWVTVEGDRVVASERTREDRERFWSRRSEGWEYAWESA